MPQHHHPIGVWRCNMCGYMGQPRYTSKVSTGGWVVFVLLLIFTCIFCWIGLLIKDTRQQCPQCFAQY